MKSKFITVVTNLALMVVVLGVSLVGFYSGSAAAVIYENDKVNSELSDRISKDLQKRGMKFVGTTIIYSFLQAVGIINSHEDGCFLCNSAMK